MSIPKSRQLSFELQRALGPGEVLLWSEQPIPKDYIAESFWLSGIGLFILGTIYSRLPELAFSATAELRLLEHGVLAGSVLLASFFLISPYLAWKISLQTVFAITDRRVVILSSYRKVNVEAYLLEECSKIQAEKKPGGRGALYFSEKLEHDRKGRPRKVRIGFTALPDVDRAARVLQEARENRLRRSTAA